MDRSVRTLTDCLELLRDFQEITAPRPERLAKRAVRDAYDTFPGLHEWNFLKRRQLITTVAPYSTGTIAFDLTGGTRERLLTLTGGTWPEWSESGRVLIDSVVYDIEERVSGTELVLAPENSPAADIAALTTFILFQSQYPMLDEIKKYTSCVDVLNQRPLFTELFERASATASWWQTPSQPIYCVQRTDTGTLKMEFYPPPEAARTYEVTYVAVPRRLQLTNPHSTGTVTVTAGSRTATFSSLTLPTNVAGAVLRLGSASDDPVGVLGSDAANTTPFNEQYRIQDWVSTSVARLSEPATVARSNVKFLIDDPIDLHPRICNDAFQRLCEQNMVVNMRYADNTGNDGGTTPAHATGRARRAIIQAIEDDSLFTPGQTACAYPTSPFDFATVVRD